jgi:integrase/recombinase XerD
MIAPSIKTAVVTTSGVTTDEQVIALWLHDKADNTKRYYTRLVHGLLYKPMHETTYPDIVAYVDSLPKGTRAAGSTAIKSLFNFAHLLGYLQTNVSLLLKVPKRNQDIAKRILPEDSVLTMIDKLRPGRNHCILRLLYHSGLRVSELCNLKWEDVQEYDGYAVMSINGKGNKLRYVRISCSMWEEMVEQAESNLYVFASRKGGGENPLTSRQVERIVASAGLSIRVSGVSPHWLRHSNASHSLDNGASLTTVRDSLGHSSIAITERYLHAKPESGSSQYIRI